METEDFNTGMGQDRDKVQVRWYDSELVGGTISKISEEEFIIGSIK